MTSDGKTLFADADEGGFHKLFAVDIATQTFESLIDTGDNTNVVMIPGSNTVLLTRDSLTFPADIWSFTYSNNQMGSLTQLTQTNDDILNQVQFITPGCFNLNSSTTEFAKESVYFTGFNNSEVQAWFLEPYGWSASLTWPLVVLIHGG